MQSCDLQGYVRCQWSDPVIRARPGRDLFGFALCVHAPAPAPAPARVGIDRLALARLSGPVREGCGEGQPAEHRAPILGHPQQRGGKGGHGSVPDTHPFENLLRAQDTAQTRREVLHDIPALVSQVFRGQARRKTCRKECGI